MKGLGWLAAVVALLSASLVSCADSGQTGSASCALPQTCECLALAGKNLVHGTVVALTAPGADGPMPVVTVEIEEVLTPSAVFDTSDVQRQLVGPLLLGAPCNLTQEPTASVGSSVLAAFDVNEYLEQFCPEYFECRQRDCSATDAGDHGACLQGCASACTPDRSSASISVPLEIQPWTDAIDTESGLTIPLSEAIELTDSATCEQRYPAPRAGACNDTPSADGDGCSLSRIPRTAGWSSPLFVALMLGAIALATSRRTTRPARSVRAPSRTRRS